MSDAAAALTGSGQLPASASAASGTDDLAYASLIPKTAPQGVIARVRSVFGGSTVWTGVVDGGFDPVAVTAAIGDTIEVVVHDASGAEVYAARAAVAAVRRPVIVRTDPPPKKRDVPLNTAIVIVFSEPIAASSLTPSSARLFRGVFPVPGTTRLLQGSGAVAVFTPAAPLLRNADYRFVVTGAVRDLEGDALTAGVTVAFTTGQSFVGPPASIVVSPDTVYMNVSAGDTSHPVTGPTYQLTATVRDAAGNLLTDQPVTWSTSEPSGLAVSPTGFLTALAGGEYQVTASVDGLTGSANVHVSAGPPASVEVSPTPATVAAGDTIILTATVRDAAGLLLYYPSVAWTSSDPAVAVVAPGSAGTFGRAFATVTGGTPGSVTITATSGEVSRTASVAVTPPPPVASVSVTPASATVIEQQTIQLFATLRDPNGKVLASRPVTWTSDNSAVATVDANGLVTAIAAGSATVTATSEGVSGTAGITVVPPPPVASVTVTPSSATVVAQGMVLLSATLRDAKDSMLARPVIWTSDNPAVATVDTTPQGSGAAWLTAVGAGSATVTATSEGVGGTASLTVTVINFASVSAGTAYSCGLTTSGAAYCWGHNWAGQLGDGSRNGRFWPAPVAGGHTFDQVSAGYTHTCAPTSTGAAYCWGQGYLGVQDGGLWHPVPVAVSGGLAFSSVSVGYDHACGLTVGGVAYCWGWNRAGQLGIGSSEDFRETPAPVAGGLTFASISVGLFHTCGVTTNGAAYCWGDNSFGQLGTGSATGPEQCVYTTSGQCSRTPVAVTGGILSSSVSAGFAHTCGITASGAGYCWGRNDRGQLGDGSTTDRPAPAAVSGGLALSSVSTGFGWWHTCGVTENGAAYCWGANDQGQLGDGSTVSSLVPVPVTGGLAFSSVSVGGEYYTCGVTTGGTAYCWGDNGFGQLGNRAGTSNVPVKVAGQP